MVRIPHYGIRASKVSRESRGTGAIALYQLTLAQSAKVADLDPEAFIELLGEADITAVDYPPEELDDEIAVSS